MADRKSGGTRCLSLVWKEGAWEVADEQFVEADLPPESPVAPDSPPPFYWDVVGPGGEVTYSHADLDPRVGFYDHVTDEGEIEGGQFEHDFAAIDVLVPDTPGAEFRLHASAEPDDADPKKKKKKTKKTKKAPAVALTHRIGGHHG